MSDLNGKISLVTGASSGIGQATAIQLAQKGSDLLLHYHSNEAGIQQTIEKLQLTGTNYDVFQCDFLDSVNLGNFCDKVWNQRGRIDLVVNNAGGDVLTTEKKNWTFEQKLEFLWNLDVQSTLAISRNLGTRMKSEPRQPKPLIVNIGWDQAPLGQAGESGQIFSTTKGAIMSFTKSLAKTLAPEVRVNCVAPGWIKTSWGDTTSEYWDQRARKESLLQRWGNANDVAQTICFLASDEAEFIIGQIVEVNGGLGFGSE